MDTNLVTIPASVVDRDGRYITNLGKEDFQIFDEGVEQQIAFFAPVDHPFTILLLIDTSGSMTPHMEDLVRAANAFVNQLRPDDQLIAASFSDSAWVTTLREVTKVRDLKKGIKLASRTGDHDTMIYEAVDHALKRMKKVRGRKAIVLFSDGVGTGYTATAKGNLRDAEEQDALIYTVQFGTFTVEPPSYVSKEVYFKRVEEINAYMRDLAKKTGGRHYRIESVSDLSKTFGQVADELRRQYSLGYYPKTKLEPGQRRQIKVRVRLPSLVVQARGSYLVDKVRAK
ncbi:MAG: VWA domain-containing protein [Pyrinomonadaceae bacterium]|nr:VWA domain-containing protein [Pyrinomonadaceae bacterium]